MQKKLFTFFTHQQLTPFLGDLIRSNKHIKILEITHCQQDCLKYQVIKDKNFCYIFIINTILLYPHVLAICFKRSIKSSSQNVDAHARIKVFVTGQSICHMSCLILATSFHDWRQSLHLDYLRGTGLNLWYNCMPV